MKEINLLKKRSPLLFSKIMDIVKDEKVLKTSLVMLLELSNDDFSFYHTILNSFLFKLKEKELTNIPIQKRCEEIAQELFCELIEAKKENSKDYLSTLLKISKPIPCCSRPSSYLSCCISTPSSYTDYE